MNLGCIGCGFIAGIHAANIHSIADARLVHVCDVREDAARSFAERFGARRWSTDPAAVLADPDVDGMLICTHPDSHAELAIAAAGAGKHLFVEKPLATTSDGCRQIISAAAAAGVTLAVDLKFRHAEAVLAVQKAVPDPVLMVAQTAMSQLPDGSPHMDPAAGGGILENLGAHLFDLLCAFAGTAPRRVFAEGWRMPDRTRTLVDAVAGTLTFPAGAVASFVVADTGEWPYASKWFYEVSNLTTQAVISEHGRRAVITGACNDTVDETDVPAHEVGARGALADFVAASRTGRMALASGADGLRSVAIIEAVHRSLREQSPVSLEVT
jgi:predicted dehydrogenase